MVTRLRVIGALLIAGLAAAGCAIPTQSVPSAIPAKQVPFGLLNPHLPTPTTTPPASVPVKIYLLAPNRRLVPESRVVDNPAPLKSVIVQLLDGPTNKETRAGIKTAIPGNVRVVSATVSKSPNDIATVNFNEAFGQIADIRHRAGRGPGGVHRGGGDQPDHRRSLPDRRSTDSPCRSAMARPLGPVYLSQYAQNAAS